MASRKHFINDPTHLVSAALHSVALTNPSVTVDAANKIVYRRRDGGDGGGGGGDRVALVSGGGSGHEPAFAGMVGEGMLSAAVAGTIFASPSAAQVRAALTGPVDARAGGALVVVMNYTGDVLNFGVAVEEVRAAGLRVDMVVGDDVGVGRARAGKVGRRGIAGTVLVLKAAGAAAARGSPLDEVARVARLAAANVASVGASLDHVHVPGWARDAGGGGGGPGPDEAEIGMGIHNEPDYGRAGLHLPRLVATMLAQLLDPGDRDRAFLAVDAAADAVVLLVNNLGGLSALEMGGVTAEVVAQLRDGYGVRPVRVWAGAVVTSLDARGFSVSLLRLVDTHMAAGMLDLLDAPCEVTGWSAPVRAETWSAPRAALATRDDHVAAPQQAPGPSGLALEDPARAQAALVRALEGVVAAEPDITRFDTVVGDGDCGIGLKRGAQAILHHLERRPLAGDAAVAVAAVVPVVETTMDGTSGALYAIFLNALVGALRASPPGRATPHVWAAALERACDALTRYTPARPGDRTLVDALYPFVEVLGKTGDVAEAARAAHRAADETRGMPASLGRAVYVGGGGYREVPDPGAWGLACFFLGLAGTEPAARG